MGKNIFKLNLTIFSFQIKQNIAVYSNPGAAEPGGAMGICAPPPHTFLKVKKVHFFLGLNAPFKERKKYFLNKLPLFLERKCPFRSSKDSVKAISDVIETPYFQKFSFGS
jgi:hypothetical protein